MKLNHLVQKTILTILSFPLLAAGLCACAWGIFCFLGGPDGRVWDPTGLTVWGISWGIAVVCGGIFLLLNRGKCWAWLVLLGAYELPFVLVFIAMTAAGIEMRQIPPPATIVALLVMLAFSMVGAIAIFYLARNLYREHREKKFADFQKKMEQFNMEPKL